MIELKVKMRKIAMWKRVWVGTGLARLIKVRAGNTQRVRKGEGWRRSENGEKNICVKFWTHRVHNGCEWVCMCGCVYVCMSRHKWERAVFAFIFISISIGNGANTRRETSKREEREREKKKLNQNGKQVAKVTLSYSHFYFFLFYYYSTFSLSCCHFKLKVHTYL